MNKGWKRKKWWGPIVIPVPVAAVDVTYGCVPCLDLPGFRLNPDQFVVTLVKQ